MTIITYIYTFISMFNNSYVCVVLYKSFPVKFKWRLLLSLCLCSLFLFFSLFLCSYFVNVMWLLNKMYESGFVFVFFTKSPELFYLKQISRELNQLCQLARLGEGMCLKWNLTSCYILAPSASCKNRKAQAILQNPVWTGWMSPDHDCFIHVSFTMVYGENAWFFLLQYYEWPLEKLTVSKQ